MKFLNYEDIKDNIVLSHDISEFPYIIELTTRVSRTFCYGDYISMYIPKNIINYITLENTMIYEIIAGNYYHISNNIRFNSDKTKFYFESCCKVLLFINDKKLYSKLKLIG